MSNVKRGFFAILVLCAAVMLGGCREGGLSLTDGFYSESVQSCQSDAWNNVGVRSSSAEASSSAEQSVGSSVSSSAEQSVGSSTESNEISSVSVRSIPQIIEEPIVSSSVGSISQGEPGSSEPPPESVAPIISEITPASSEVFEISSESTSERENAFKPPVPTESVPETSTASQTSTTSQTSEVSEISVSPLDYEGTVYIAASGSGKRYHKNPRCSGMRGTLPMTVDEALKKGYTPCKRCW